MNDFMNSDVHNGAAASIRWQLKHLFPIKNEIRIDIHYYRDEMAIVNLISVTCLSMAARSNHRRNEL